MEVRKGSNGKDYQWTGDAWEPVGQQSMASVGQAAGAIGSSIALEPLAGLAGIAGAVLPGEQGQGAQWVENVRNMSYQPENANSLQALGGLLSPVMDTVGRGLNVVEDFATKTISPMHGAVAPELPAIALTLAGAGPARTGLNAAAQVPRQALGATGRAAGRVGDAVGDVGGMAQRAADIGGAGPMAQRLLGRIGRGADDVPPVPGKAIMASEGDAGAVLQGFLSPEEARILDLPLTRGDELALAAQTQDELRHATAVRRAEDLRSSDQWFGEPVRKVRSQQKDWATNQVKQRLDIPGEVNITDDVLGQKLNELGSQFDNWANSLGNTPLGEDTLAALDDIVEQSTTESRSLVTQIVNDTKQMAAANDGRLSGQDWQVLRTRIGKMVESGANQGVFPKVADGNRLMDTLTDALEAAAPAEAREAIQLTRTQYGLAKALLKRSGNLSADGVVNSNSLYGTLKKSRSIRNRSSDSLMRMLETDRYLTRQLVGNSGTFERAAANPLRTGIRAATGATGLDILFGE